jgi:DNA topoisomerase III
MMVMAVPEPSTVAVLAEKPSVARDIARELGAARHGDGYLHGNGYVVTWALGHLAALAQPHEIHPEWRAWRRETLPLLPRRWPLVVCEKTKEQFEIVKRILVSPRVSHVVCATDAGREGELIFRYIYEAAQCQKPVSRLWVSSLTPEAIRKGFEQLRPASEYDSLANAARGRSRADWLVGINLSRAYSLAYGESLSVGRVQTPTLAMLVERELAIRRFVPEDYLEVVAEFRPASTTAASSYKGTWFRPRPDGDSSGESLRQSMRLPADGEEAARIVQRARTGRAAIESVKSESVRMAPPLLYDLTELQRHANRLFGFSAQKTLDLAQALYETHKLLSYPRTDSRYLSQDVAQTLARIVRNIEGPYREHLAAGTGDRALGRRFVDDSKVTDHHAIIPTSVSPASAKLSAEERQIYDLVCRRLLSAWQPDHVWSLTTVITAIANGNIIDRFHASGTAIEQQGWKVLDVISQRNTTSGKESGEDSGTNLSLPAGLAKGQPQDVVGVDAVKKKTRPPRRFTEATLLTAMETAGKTLDERELSEAMKECGLGTPATRAAIIEVLLKREYVVRRAKNLEVTEKGIRLIEVVHPEVKSPAMTGQWEAYLKRIQDGRAELEPFLKGIEDYVSKVVGKVGEERPAVAVAADAPAEGPLRRSSDPLPMSLCDTRQAMKTSPRPFEGEGGERSEPGEGIAARPNSLRQSAAPSSVQSPPSNGGLTELLHSAFGFSSFRPNQEAVCQAMVGGRDVLLVMPTGTGKSLCYQLPGIARGGTTLVISPLIALMEDQVAKLKEHGCAVDRIHSGRPRSDVRSACLAYLSGKLQFLFIAPERLRVAGFPEMLGRRPLSLIAIDEAHCISQWGHDFRPDYRMLGEHLPRLRPAPVIALTATATPIVQKDIADQLKLVDPAFFVHGFRRANIAIEVVEVPPFERTDRAGELLRDLARRPAIVYAPTRKQAESLAVEFASFCSAAAYHAGLDPATRQRVQEAFLDGKIEVIVATIAFGMGVDKPDIRSVIHVALPGSLEAYYQEIGRAGRDGAPSRAILMHSYADRRTHDYFFERDYPDVTVLDAIYRLLRPEPQPKAALQSHLRFDEGVFDKALEKLWTHGGAVVDFAENVSLGRENWHGAYRIQVEQRMAQLEQIIRFTESQQCRMAALVRHFGDFADAGKPCGICDFCAPGQTSTLRFRNATERERNVMLQVAGALGAGYGKSTGRLYGELFPDGNITRDAFEDVLGAMARAGLVELSDEIFEKDGRPIPYRKARLTRSGAAVNEKSEVSLLMTESAPPLKRKKKRRAAASGSPERRSKSLQPVRATATPAVKTSNPNVDSRLEAALRVWRLTEARRCGCPAFRIFTDRTLRELAVRRPHKTEELLAVPGIGNHIVKKYGRDIYRVLRENGG